jgi:thioredoxin reductase
VYAASEGLATVTLDAVATGGQAGTSPRIENYPGFPSGISGSELTERTVIQAEKFGARLSVPAAATALERRDGHHLVRLGHGQAVGARTVVVATGARYRRLAVPRLEEFEGTCVHYAATPVEAQLCRGGPVVVEAHRPGWRRRLAARAPCAILGAEPPTGWLGDQLALDDRGFILTGDGVGRNGGRRPSLLETSQPGVFAVGDVRSGSIKRVTSAVGEGAMAVRLVHEYLEVE